MLLSSGFMVGEAEGCHLMVKKVEFDLDGNLGSWMDFWKALMSDKMMEAMSVKRKDWWDENWA